ncbi:MAG: FKBP-type peptidyl-prolyl cis-trans isomerase [Planctomycetaceae bacterium]|nr:FKBP-type peptidyl-prolyl cis-trans isomerase [Planctomycetaceae bacterium]
MRTEQPRKSDPTIPVSASSEVRPGDLVTIHYTSKNRDGGIFETSQNRRPLRFEAGRDGVVEGLSEAVIGMRPGDCKCVEIAPERGFGLRDASLELTIPRSMLPDRMDEGDQLTVSIGEREVDVWVRQIGSKTAVIDANHPLAGETLFVDVQLVATERPAR